MRLSLTSALHIDYGMIFTLWDNTKGTGQVFTAIGFLILFVWFLNVLVNS